jgi:diguanylate cyclase (GGDEF)-like protein/excisionase family DNA binding protein
MSGRLRELPRDFREQTVVAVREQEVSLCEDIAAGLSAGHGFEPNPSHQLATLLLSLLGRALEDGEIDSRQGIIQGLTRFTPPITIRQLVQAVQDAERIVLDELALHDRLGATSEPWPIVASAVRAGMLEIVAAFAERQHGRAAVRDPLTTLIARDVFDLVLRQEGQRAHRHGHGLAVMLFDIDDLGRLNRLHGYGAGDRLLERLGILARSFFRTHDWVARHGEDSIGVLLPEATLDQAAALATRFCEMVEQRLVLVDHKTDTTTTVTVSASAVGTDMAPTDIDPANILLEAEAAVLRAKMDGGNRVERVALLAKSVTLVGAAALIGTSAREVVRLVRSGALRATRRGRHYQIDRVEVENYCSRR